MPTIVDNSELREGSGKIRKRGGGPVLEETYHYLVQADHKTQTRAEILLLTVGLPKLGDPGPFGATVCVDVTADRDQENPLYWRCTAEFSSEIEDGSGAPENNSGQPFTPEAWIPEYETKYEIINETSNKDASGTTIANSAGLPFETGIVLPRHIPIWEFYQFEPATVTDEQVIERSEVVNGSTFKGKAAKTLLCVVLSSVRGRYFGQRRRLTQYQLKYNKNDWRHKRRDVGTQYKSGTTLITFVADNSVYLGALNGSGGAQAVGTPPAIREFDVYATSDFSFLRI